MFHPADTRVLARAREKRKHKPSDVVVKPTVEKVGQVELARTANQLAAGAAGQGAAAGVKVSPGPAGQPARVLAAAAIGNFKAGGTRARRATRGARSHLVATHLPWTDRMPGRNC